MVGLNAPRLRAGVRTGVPSMRTTFRIHTRLVPPARAANMLPNYPPVRRWPWWRVRPSDPPAFVGRSSADRWAIVGRLSGDCWASSHAILYPMNQAKCSALARCADPIPKDLRSVTDQTKHRSQESSLFACSLTGISGSAGCPDQAGERRR